MQRENASATCRSRPPSCLPLKESNTFSFRDIQYHHQSAAAVLLGIVVGRVVWNMAMNQPFARTTCRPNNIVALPRSDIDRIGFIERAFPERLPVKCHHRERTAMYMHRV